MAEMPDVVTLTPITINWGNQIRDRTVQRYSSVANRTTEHPTPAEGDLSYLEDSNSVWVYNGTLWQLVGPDLEVDGSAEDAAYSLTTTPTAVVTVNLTIPTTWASWKCEAYATFYYAIIPSSLGSIRMRIDGTDQQLTQFGPGAGPDTLAGLGAVGGRRTGMTTTGSRAISLIASASPAGGFINNSYLYARAVRTS